MVEPRVDGNELDWKMERLRHLAEEMFEAAASLDDSTFRQFLYRDEQGTDYCSQQYGRLYRILDDFWKFQLGLLWDALPKQRQAALRFCKERFEAASRTLTESFKKSHAARLTIGFERLGQASVLLGEPGQVTTAQFADGAYALAEAYALCFLSIDQDEWMVLKSFYQDLYHVFNPEPRR